MRRSLLWVVTLFLPIIFLGLLTYLVKDSVFSFNWSQLKANDLINVVALAIGFFGAFIAIGSLFVAVSQLQQGIEDGKEQRQSLNASRAQLEAVVESLKKQHQLQTESLESTKSLVTLQERAVKTTKELQNALAQSLETSKAMLALQEEERQRALELASRKAKLILWLSDQEIKDNKVTTTLHVDKNNHASLTLAVKNVGSAPALKPLYVASASPQEVSVVLENAAPNRDAPYHSQISGPTVADIPPFSISQRVFKSRLKFIVPATVSEFDLSYSISSENLDSLFKAVIHIQVNRE